MLAPSIPVYVKMYECDDCGKLATRVYSIIIDDVYPSVHSRSLGVDKHR